MSGASRAPHFGGGNTYTRVNSRTKKTAVSVASTNTHRLRQHATFTWKGVLS